MSSTAYGYAGFWSNIFTAVPYFVVSPDVVGVADDTVGSITCVGSGFFGCSYYFITGWIVLVSLAFGMI